MNKLFISIIALAALSSAAYAINDNRNDNRYDLRGEDTCKGRHCLNVKKPTTSSNPSTFTVVSPLAITEKDGALTAFERMKKNSEEKVRGDH